MSLAWFFWWTKSGKLLLKFACMNLVVFGFGGGRDGDDEGYFYWGWHVL